MMFHTYLGNPSIMSMMIGLSLGLLYGYLFMWQYATGQPISDTTDMRRAIILSSVRLLGLIFILYLLLKLLVLHPILVVFTFIVGFWAMLLYVVR